MESVSVALYIERLLKLSRIVSYFRLYTKITSEAEWKFCAVLHALRCTSVHTSEVLLDYLQQSHLLIPSISIQNERRIKRSFQKFVLETITVNSVAFS